MPKTQPPPNYLSRSFQLRMLSLVAALGIVAVAMSMARNPANWSWFFHIGSGSSGTKHVDTRVRFPQDQDAQPLVAGNDSWMAPAEASSEELAWSQVLELLGDDVRTQLELVIRGAISDQLYALDDEARQRLLSDLDRSWASIDSDPPSGNTDGTAPPSIQSIWQRHRSALDAAIEHDTLTAEQRQTLVELDHAFDRIACRQIRDHSPHRRAETMAWSRLLWTLKTTPPERLKSLSVGEVSFLQLFDQPQVYRCQVVSIRGFVRRIERIPSRLSQLKINQLFRLWLKPADGTDAPFVVYCLQLPAGLPKPTAKQSMIKREPPGELVTIEAYFFKNWLYQGADRTAFLAPLLLAREPKYEPPPAEPESTRPDLWTTITYSALIAACISLAFTWYVWRLRPEPTDPPSLTKLREIRAARGEPIANDEEEPPDFDALQAQMREDSGSEGEHRDRES